MPPGSDPPTGGAAGAGLVPYGHPRSRSGLKLALSRSSSRRSPARQFFRPLLGLSIRIFFRSQRPGRRASRRYRRIHGPPFFVDRVVRRERRFQDALYHWGLPSVCFRPSFPQTKMADIPAVLSKGLDVETFFHGRFTKRPQAAAGGNDGGGPGLMRISAAIVTLGAALVWWRRGQPPVALARNPAI